MTQFVYDGAGNRVLQIKPDGNQTGYVGNLLEVEFVAPPAAPSSLSGANLGTGVVALAWADNSAHESGFQIERKATLGKALWTPVGTTGANSVTYQDSPGCDSSYWYRVRAYNVMGHSAYSNEVLVNTDCNAALHTAGKALLSLAYLGEVPAPLLQTAPPAGQIWKSYYFAGGQLVALRVQGDPASANNGVYFLHGDHTPGAPPLCGHGVGSTSLTTDANGNPVARQLYDAWGNLRSGGVGSIKTLVIAHKSE